MSGTCSFCMGWPKPVHPQIYKMNFDHIDHVTKTIYSREELDVCEKHRQQALKGKMLYWGIGKYYVLTQ